MINSRFKVPRWAVPMLLGLSLVVVAMTLPGPGTTAQAQVSITDRPMPEFQNQNPDFWVNSKPLKKADLHGKVLLVEIWTSI